MNITRVKITCDDGTLFDSGELDTTKQEYPWKPSSGVIPVLKLVYTGRTAYLALYHDSNEDTYICISDAGYIYTANTDNVMLLRS